MKTVFFLIRLVAIACLALFCGFAMAAAEQNPSTSIATPAITEKASPNPGSSVQLLANAAEVLKLSRAQISDETIVAFVRSSKTAYNLNANEIVYLRQQEVSERVITAMLEQRPPAAATWTATTSPQQGNSTASPSYIAQPSTTFVQTAPVYVSPPPAYAYPAPANGYNDFGYGVCWGIPFPSLSFNFGFGHRFHGGGFGGGFHGGPHR